MVRHEVVDDGLVGDRADPIPGFEPRLDATAIIGDAGAEGAAEGVWHGKLGWLEVVDGWDALHEGGALSWACAMQGKKPCGGMF